MARARARARALGLGLGARARARGSARTRMAWRRRNWIRVISTFSLCDASSLIFS